MASWGHRLFGGHHKKDENEQQASAPVPSYAAPSGPPPQQSPFYAPPAGPPPGSYYAPPTGTYPGQSYAPPSGPPPGQGYAPPAGPPPGQGYAPPPGPPPTYVPPRAPPPQTSYAAAPAAAPPPSYEEIESHYSSAPEPFAPPPPVLSYIASPALNASEDEFEAGMQFVRTRPFAPPRQLSSSELHDMESGKFSLIAPPGMDGHLKRGHDHTTLIKTHYARDSTVVSALPLYSAQRRAPPTVYYELQVVKMGRDGSIAIGMAAIPYPPFRLPGWHRGSIAVHADDGHRYSNDPTGGVDFTEPFVPGDIVGLGLELHTGQVWFTRNGVLAGGWNLRSDRTVESDEYVGEQWEGLDASRDVYAAIGICGEAQCIVNLGGERTGKPWAWTPAY